MLKALFKTNYLLLSVFVLSFLVIPAVSMAQANKAALDGSFITGSLCGFWADARWQQEFTAMKNAGMHYIILSSVAHSIPGEKAQMLYPSSLPNTEMAKGANGVTYPDVVDACLRNAQAAGIKVFVGIDLSDRWSNSHADDSTWLYSQMNFDNSICDEVWSLYKNKYPDAFYGWYWAYEVDNVNFTTKTQQRVLTNAMNMQLDHLSATNEKLPFMWCPYMTSNSNLSGTPQDYQAMWQNVFSGLHTTSGDIFCPQDGIGVGHLNLSNLASWFSALRQAVNTKPGLVMWSDVETFDIDRNSATMDRIISQLKIEQPYVDNYITWEYCYYDSPNNIDSGFQTTYIDYLNTGSLETTPPTSPQNFTAVLQPSGDEVILSWDASTDDIGVCGYYVYRNGAMIYKNQVPRISDSTKIKLPLTSFTDGGLSPNTTYTYQVEAYDFANNVSAPTLPITIKTGILPNKVSGGCPYTVSIPANSKYPDPNGKKLTDGIYASRAYYADPAWVGFNSGSSIDVVIDLGKIMPVQYFIADYLFEPRVGVYLPAEVKVLVSTDNITFTGVESLVPILNSNIPYDSLDAIYKYYGSLSNPVDARYIKFSTIRNGNWTFCDEYEVRNSAVKW
jgi:hypothetical protein